MLTFRRRGKHADDRRSEMPDGRRVLYTLDSGTFIADPESSASPRALALPEGASEVSPMPDTTSYRAWLDNKMVIVHTDGRPMEQLVGQNTLGGNTPDDRWRCPRRSVRRRRRSSRGAGRGRRLVIAGGSRFSQAAWATGGEKFIVVDVGNEFVKTAEDRDRSDSSRGPQLLPSDAGIPPGEANWTARPPLATFEREKEIPLRSISTIGSWSRSCCRR